MVLPSCAILCTADAFVPICVRQAIGRPPRRDSRRGGRRRTGGYRATEQKMIPEKEAPGKSRKESMSYQPIENYGIIGDLHTVALVGMDGSIDFMCAPHFDSPSVFAALLDDEKGGGFKIAPTFNNVKHRQLNLPDTNMLLTRFLSHDGVAEVSDFMPVEAEGRAHQLVRRAKTVRGVATFRMTCAPAFDYGRAHRKPFYKHAPERRTVRQNLALRYRANAAVSFDRGCSRA